MNKYLHNSWRILDKLLFGNKFISILNQGNLIFKYLFLSMMCRLSISIAKIYFDSFHTEKEESADVYAIKKKSIWTNEPESDTFQQSYTLWIDSIKWGVKNSFSDRDVSGIIRNWWQQIHSWAKNRQGGKQEALMLILPFQLSRT